MCYFLLTYNTLPDMTFYDAAGCDCFCLSSTRNSSRLYENCPSYYVCIPRACFLRFKEKIEMERGFAPIADDDSDGEQSLFHARQQPTFQFKDFLRSTAGIFMLGNTVSKHSVFIATNLDWGFPFLSQRSKRFHMLPRTYT